MAPAATSDDSAAPVWEDRAHNPQNDRKAHLTMDWMKTFAVGCTLALTACASTSPETASRITSVRAVELANAAAPDGVAGVFVMEVRGSEATPDVTYLSSELDYRDQRNLAIVITRPAVEALEVSLGAPPADALRGRRILVDGIAERVQISFSYQGIPIGAYYYQTQLRVTDASQIRLVDAL